MAGLDTLLSLAGGGGSTTSAAKYIAPEVPINVQPVGLNLGQLFQPSNLGTTGTVPLLAGGPTQAAVAQAEFLSGANMPLLLIAVVAGFVLLQGR
jgi:hypothetical protein